LDKSSELLLKNAPEKFKLSARGYRRVQRVARTLADLEKCEIIQEHHVAEALSYRRFIIDFIRIYQ
jgi:magnesium chelatase family protein